MDVKKFPLQAENFISENFLLCLLFESLLAKCISSWTSFFAYYLHKVETKSQIRGVSKEGAGVGR